MFDTKVGALDHFTGGSQTRLIIRIVSRSFQNANAAGPPWRF